MLNIKEIALKICRGMNPYSDLHESEFIYFANKLIEFYKAELLKEVGEPVAFTNSAQLGYVTSGQHQDIPLAMWSRNTSYSGADIPLYTIPPTAEQIANETAEACARYVNRFINGDGILNEVWISEIEEALRNGAWKGFKK